MNEDQFETLASLFAGIQMAVVHLSNVVAQSAGIDKVRQLAPRALRGSAFSAA